MLNYLLIHKLALENLQWVQLTSDYVSWSTKTAMVIGYLSDLWYSVINTYFYCLLLLPQTLTLLHQ